MSLDVSQLFQSALLKTLLFSFMMIQLHIILFFNLFRKSSDVKKKKAEESPEKAPLKPTSPKAFFGSTPITQTKKPTLLARRKVNFNQICFPFGFSMLSYMAQCHIVRASTVETKSLF